MPSPLAPPPSPRSPIEAGVSLGPFRLVRQLGRGGFAPVWLAEEVYERRKLRDVAIKLFVVPESIAGAPEAAARWRDEILDEAQALCRVEHPNVVRFYALQRDDARGAIGLVMEYVAGRSLEEAARAAGKMSERAALEAVAAVAWALAAVHAAGIVHRDVKPANVVQGASGYRLIDFGIAAGTARGWSEGRSAPPLSAAPAPSLADPFGATAVSLAPAASAPASMGAPAPAGVTLTATGWSSGQGIRGIDGVIVGTPGYIAPECVLQGEPATPASDLFALGVTLFRLLTGRLPAESDGVERSAHELLVPQGRAPSLTALLGERSAASAMIARLTAALLDPDPLARPRHADWVAREIERALAAIDPARAALAAGAGGDSGRFAPVTDPQATYRIDRGEPPPGPARIDPTAARAAEVTVVAADAAPPTLDVAPPAPPAPPALDERPAVVGRDAELTALARLAREAREGHARVAVLSGHQGTGRSRLLEAAADLAGWGPRRALRLRCYPERRSPLYPLRRALEELSPEDRAALGALPEAVDRAVSPALVPGADEVARAVEAIEDALLRASADAPLLLLVDDLQWSDTATLELVKLLVRRAAAGGRGRILLVAAARHEPSRPAPLRSLLGEVRARACPGVAYLGLGPLPPADAARLAQAVCPLAPEVERAVVTGSGGVPFFIVHALVAWREAGAVVFRDGVYAAADERVLRGEVPEVADLLEARVASFAGEGPAERCALRALAATALAGGGLPVEVILRVAGDEDHTEAALEALASAGVLTVAGERQEYSFAQEMVRQAALNLLRQRPWFQRLHRALLDAIAGGAGGRVDAAFLATGYERLGAAAEARLWLGRAMEEAAAAGLFAEAAALGDRLAALTPDPEARAAVELDAARALIRGRSFGEARRRLARVEERGAGARGGALDLRRRIHRLEVARGLREAGEGDAALIADADALGDAALRCEARMALAGVAPKEEAMGIAGEAVALAAAVGPALELSARVLRFELNCAQDRRDHALLEADLQRELAIAAASSSLWHRVHIEGDLAVLETELGRNGAAIERLRRLAGEAERHGMRGQLRLLLQNLATCLMREERAAEAAEAALRTAELAVQDGDPVLRATALSLRAAALARAGDLAAALESADLAEQLQRERGDRSRALTLLRRAEIRREMGRMDEAMRDAEAARRVAEGQGDPNIAAGARLWEALRLAQRGDAPAAALAQIVEEVRAANTRLSSLPRSLMREAEAWLADRTTAE